MELKFHVVNADTISWQKSEMAEGVEVKKLGAANGRTMELYRFPPDTSYPDHYHEGPEFVYLVEGSARHDGKWLEAGWASTAETGTLDKDFLSGERGCVLLTVYSSVRYVDAEVGACTPMSG